MKDEGEGEPSLMTTLTNPHDLLAAVPFLIGYHPEDSLVLLSIRDQSVGVAMRIDFPEEVDRDQIEVLIAHLRRQECDGVLVVAYLPDGAATPNPISQALCIEISAVGINLHESLEVRGGRWRSIICGDEVCCPPEGNPLPEFTSSPVTAEHVAEGVALPYSDVHELRSSLYAKEPSVALLAELAQIDPIDYFAPDFNRLQREGALAVDRLIAEFDEKGVEVGRDLVALVLVRLRDLQIRDYALGIADSENHLLLTSLWRWLTSLAPQGFAAAPATLYSELMYESGEGAIATRALERALADTPDYPLAKLLRRTYAAGWEPSQFRQMRSELHPRICQALFADLQEG